MNKNLVIKQIQAAIFAQDQLVFVYRKNPSEVIVRYVTPFEIVAHGAKGSSEPSVKVLCAQHLPEEGYRYFFLDKIDKFHRVISRDVFSDSSFFKSTEPSKDPGEV